MEKKRSRLSTCCLSLLIFGFAYAQDNLNEKADSLFRLGNYSKALEYYQQLPSNTPTLYSKAMVYQAMGNYHRAIGVLEEVVQQDSSHALSKFELGKLYLRASDLQNAQLQFQELIIQDPTNPNYHYQLGRIRRGLNDSLYIGSFRQAIQLDQKFVKAIEEIAKYHLQQKDLDQAIQYCEQGLAVYDGNSILLGYKGQAHFLAGQDSLAVAVYEKLKDMGFGNETVYSKLAYSHYNLRNYEEAISNGLRLLDLKPENSEYHYLMGLNYYESNEFDKSAEHFETAVELKKVSSANEYLRLVDIYQQQKDYRNAIKYYKLLVNEVPDYIIGYYQIAFLGDQYYKDSELKIYHYKSFLKKAADKPDQYLEKYKEHARQRVLELRAGIHFDTDDG